MQAAEVSADVDVQPPARSDPGAPTSGAGPPAPVQEAPLPALPRLARDVAIDVGLFSPAPGSTADVVSRAERALRERGPAAALTLLEPARGSASELVRARALIALGALDAAEVAGLGDRAALAAVRAAAGRSAALCTALCRRR